MKCYHPTRRQPRRRSHLVALCLGLIAAACQRGPTQLEVAQRFIEHDSGTLLKPDVAWQSESVFVWRFEDRSDLTPWKMRDLEALDLSGRVLNPTPSGLVFRAQQLSSRLSRNTRIKADEVDVIEMVIAGSNGTGAVPNDGHAQLYWTRRNESFDRSRSLSVALRKSPGGKHRFMVADHPLWSGTITNLRFDPTSMVDVDFVIERIEGLAYMADAEAKQRTLGRAWKVDLGNEVRSAMPCPPELEIRRTIEIPKQASLQFGYGLQTGLDRAVDFSILLVEPSGKSSQLFTAHVEPQEAGWHDGEVDLADFAGKTVELVLTTSSDSGPIDPTLGLPFWTSPQVWGRPSRRGRREKRPNVILISLDTLRPDHLSTYGYERPTSPHIDAWAAERGIVFETAIAPSPWTLPSHVSMLSGMGALEHSYNYRRPLEDDLVLLSEILQSDGYRTYAMTGGGHVSPQLGWSQGFDRFAYWPPRVDPIREIETVVDRGIEWLEKADERPPFFLFLHSYETHSPFIPRQPHFSRLAPELEVPQHFLGTMARPTLEDNGYQQTKWFVERENNSKRTGSPLSDAQLPLVIASYDSSIAHADEQIGRLLAALEEGGLLEDTLVVLTSDHGEALGEKNLAGHSYLWDFNLRVPLILSLPRNASSAAEGAPRRVARQVRLEDLTPTILDVVGLEPRPNMSGRSLLPLIDSPRSSFPTTAWSYAATSNYGISLRLDDGRKLIYNNTLYRRPEGIEALFDVTIDPQEERELTGEPELRAALREQLFEHLDHYRRGIEIRLHNPTDRPFDGAIHAPNVRVSELKSLDVPPGAVQRFGDGITRYVVQPGQSYSILLEGPSLGRATFYVYQEDSQLAKDLSLLGADEVWGGLRQGELWSTSNGPLVPGAASVSISRLGFHNQAAEPELDEDLQQQLKALGYL